MCRSRTPKRLWDKRSERSINYRWFAGSRVRRFGGRKANMIGVPIIECVPNISEGRRTTVVEEIIEALRRGPGVRLLDWSSDTSHNRSVITLAGDAVGLTAAVLVLFEKAIAAIDLRTHTGEHPRMGAVDVVPFVPIEGVTREDCIVLAKDTARTVDRKR